MNSSVYIILKANVNISPKVKAIISEYNAMFDNSSKGIMLHFQDVSWSPFYEDSVDVESFLATLPKSSFLFIRLTSLDDIDVAGSYFNNPYKNILPRNLVEFLEESF